MTVTQQLDQATIRMARTMIENGKSDDILFRRLASTCRITTDDLIRAVHDCEIARRYTMSQEQSRNIDAGSQVKELRVSLGMSRKLAAELSGLSYKMIVLLDRGDRLDCAELLERYRSAMIQYQQRSKL